MAPNAKLTVAGDITPSNDNSSNLGSSTFRWATIFAASGTINTSDKRLKDNVKEISYGLEEILKLNPVSYSWKDQPETGTKLGLIAQEVLPIIEEVVNVGDDPDQTLGIYYSDLVPVLIKALQEQQKIIDEMKIKMEGVDELKSKMAQFELLLQQRTAAMPAG